MSVNHEDWMAEGLCVGVNPDLFFPGHGGDVSAAKAICAECPVKVPCLTYALQEGIKHGIWGGRSEKERRKMRRRRFEMLDNQPITFRHLAAVEDTP